MQWQLSLSTITVAAFLRRADFRCVIENTNKNEVHTYVKAAPHASIILECGLVKEIHNPSRAFGASQMGPFPLRAKGRLRRSERSPIALQAIGPILPRWVHLQMGQFSKSLWEMGQLLDPFDPNESI